MTFTKTNLWPFSALCQQPEVNQKYPPSEPFSLNLVTVHNTDFFFFLNRAWNSYSANNVVMCWQFQEKFITCPASSSIRSLWKYGTEVANGTFIIFFRNLPNLWPLWGLLVHAQHPLFTLLVFLLPGFDTIHSSKRKNLIRFTPSATLENKH